MNYPAASCGEYDLERIKQGFQFISFVSDSRLLMGAAQETVKNIREAMKQPPTACFEAEAVELIEPNRTRLKQTSSQGRVFGGIGQAGGKDVF